jgi:hypothetical protein
VQATAANLDIDLDLVPGSGPGGEVTVQDVYSSPPGARRGYVPPVRAGSPVAVQRAAAAPSVSGPEYARNPHVDERRVSSPALVALARREGPAPTLFETGDLPPFTASGLDPQLLLQLPWQLRHAAATATDRGVVLRMFEHYAGPDGANLAEMEHRRDPGNFAYAARVGSWLSGMQMKPYSLLAADDVQRVSLDGSTVGEDYNQALFDAMFPKD